MFIRNHIKYLHILPKFRLSLHEYQTADLFKSYQLPVPPGRICKTPEEAFKAAVKIMNIGAEDNTFTDVVVKAQVHTGGRGKGYFKENGFHSVF